MVRTEATARETGHTDTSNRRAPSWVTFVGLGVAIVILIVFRRHAFELPLETDECNYAYIGARLLAGDRLYVDVWDHQPPGVFVLFAAAIRFLGDEPPVFRWMALGFSALSLILIFGVANRVAGRSAGLIAALLFAVVSSDPGTGGEGCNREIYMNALILAGVYCIIRGCGIGHCSGGRADCNSGEIGFGATKKSPFTPPEMGWLIIAGFAFAFASYLKTVAALPWSALAVMAVTGGRRITGKPPGKRVGVRGLIAFSIGPALLWTAATAHFTATHRLSEFYDAVFLANVGYVETGESFWVRFFRFFRPLRHPLVFESALPLWIVAGISLVGLVYVAIRRRDRGVALLVGLALGCFLAVCLPGRFWPHYYYLLIPATVLLAAIGCAKFNQVLQSLRLIGGRSEFGAVAAGVVVLTAATWTEARDYLRQPPFGITVDRYNSRDFWGRAQGENVARVTDPTDKVFVFSNDASIYYYSGRRCASRYTMITGLAAGIPGAEERRRILLQELGADPPRVIVVSFDEKPFDGWLEFLERYYGQAVGVDNHDTSETRGPILLVFARKDRPIPMIDWDWDRKSVGGWDPRNPP